MLFLRLKQCETAVAGGRLDEAFDLARASDVRAHRRGQVLAGRLVRALLERGRAHLAAGRLPQAAADCGKAEHFAGNDPDVAQLRQAVTAASLDRQNVERARGQAFAAARLHAERGELTLGGLALEAAPAVATDERAEALRRDLEVRRAAIESAVAKASDALDRGDWEAAIDHLAAARRGRGAPDPKARELTGKICRRVVDEAGRALQGGRPDLAGSLLTRLDRLGDGGGAGLGVEVEQLRRTLAELRRAVDCVKDARPRRGEQILRSLIPLWPSAKWIAPAAERLREMGEAMEELTSGPLGLAAHLASPPPGAAQGSPFESTIAHTPASSPPPPQVEAPVFSASPRWVIQVDGVGSFLVLSDPHVTIGPDRSSARPDVALMADPAAPRVTLSRSDGDYFVKSAEAVHVNDKPVTGKLLAPGDQIALAPRCRLRFRRPSAASGTAVLDLTGARMRRADLRHVILLDRELILGPGPGSHVRDDQMPAPAVLQLRGGQWVCKAQGDILVDGQPAGRAADVTPGKQIKVGETSFVVTAA